MLLTDAQAETLEEALGVLCENVEKQPALKHIEQMSANLAKAIKKKESKGVTTDALP